jgi:hypothetical protein
MRKWIYDHCELIAVVALWLLPTGFYMWWWWSMWTEHHRMWEKSVLAPLPIIWVGALLYGLYRLRTA